MKPRADIDVESRRGEVWEWRERGLEAGFLWEEPFNNRPGLKEKRGDFMLGDFSIEWMERWRGAG